MRCKGTAQGANLTCVDEGSILSLTRAVVNAWVRTPHSAEAWIEPGLRQYALYRYLEDYDDERADAMLAQAKDALLCYQVRHGTTGEDARMDKDVHDCDEEAYHALMEHKALLLWCSLAEVAGSGVRQAAQALAVCDKSLTTADVADALRTHTRRDYGYYLEAWIGGNVTYCHCPWGNGST